METMEKYVTAITSSSRLNREDCRHAEHDSAFTKWKVLVGSSDWEDHSNGKEGAERYRTQNLPNCTSCPGVYEFGVAARSNKTGRESGKLDPDFIIPVYLGKSDNIRNRLRQYGRDGSHLEHGTSNAKLNDCCEILAQKGPGLFRRTFSEGCSIVFRWAPVKSARDAEKTESDLLNKYDYAWNRGSNGPRRPNDIHKKLLSQKNKIINIKAYEPPYLNLETNCLLHQIFKFGRSQPRLVVRSGINENYAGICGVALGHGVICKRAPIEGNKRCSDYKGMKVNGFFSKLLTDGKSTLVANDYPINDNFTQVSGVILDDGSCCTSKPVQGNRRCREHKGRKICNSTPQLVKDKEEHYVYGPILDCNTRSKAGKQYIHKDGICGVDLDDGTFCTRQPPAGGMRCEEHKGMRIKENTCISRREETPSFFEHSGSKSGREKSQNHCLIPSVSRDKISPTCEAATQDGSSCRRKAAEGDERRWQHKSVGVNASPGSSSCDNLRRTNTTSEYASYSSVYEYFSSSTCGKTLQNGSFCSRKPTEGNKRCWQHKGMWADSSTGSSNNSRYYTNSYRYASSSTCGATTRKGSYCRRSTSGGRCGQHGG